MNPVIIILALAGTWLVFRKKDAMQPAVPTSYPTNYQPAQPSQMYPWMPISPPRVDNQNQPWYVGPRGFMQGPAENSMVNFAQTVQAGASVVHSLSDVWGDLAGIFGGDDAKSNLMAPDAYAFDDSWMSDSFDESETDFIGEESDYEFA